MRELVCTDLQSPGTLQALISCGRGENDLGDELTARLKAEWGKLGKWDSGPSDTYPAGASGLDA